MFGITGKNIKLKDCSIVFCFHSISDDGWLFSVTENNFELFLKELMKTRSIVSLEDLLDKKDENINNKVAITFDDGYKSVLTLAYPILKKYGLTACVFVSGYKSEMEGSNYFEGRKLLSLEQVRKLKKENWVIGYHTKSHSDLRFVSNEKLIDEIIYGKKELENKLGYKIDYFAYPYGVFDKKVINIVKKADYKYAFTTDGNGVNFYKSPFKVSRVLLDKYTKVEDLRVLTSWEGLFFNRFLTMCYRIKDNYFSKPEI